MHVFRRESYASIADTDLNIVIGIIKHDRHLPAGWGELAGIIDQRIDHKERQRLVGLYLKCGLRHLEGELLLGEGILLHRDDMQHVGQREARHLQAETSLLYLYPLCQTVVDVHHARAKLLYV